MRNYTFNTLNDKEFELLSVDLLSCHLGIDIDRFKPGRDHGVDGRFFSNNNHEVIIQCKHYLHTGYKGLLYKLKNDELPKIKKLSPKRYILTTTVSLSRVEKKRYMTYCFLTSKLKMILLVQRI